MVKHEIIKIKLGGLTCEACQKIAEKRLSKLANIMSVSVSLTESIATITAMHSITEDEVKEALKDTEYTVIGLSAQKENL